MSSTNKLSLKSAGMVGMSSTSYSDEWKPLTPTDFVEAFGTVLWNGKNRLIVLPARLTNLVPEIRERKSMAIFKLELFLSRKKYMQRTQEIIAKSGHLPMHLYIQWKRKQN